MGRAVGVGVQPRKNMRIEYKKNSGELRPSGLFRSCVALVSAASLVLSTGCSLIFVSGPPDHPETLPPSAPIDCTSSKVTPVIDTVVTGLQVVRTAVAASAHDSDYSGQPISRQADIGFGVGFAALF